MALIDLVRAFKGEKFNKYILQNKYVDESGSSYKLGNLVSGRLSNYYMHKGYYSDDLNDQLLLKKDGGWSWSLGSIMGKGFLYRIRVPKHAKEVWWLNSGTIGSSDPVCSLNAVLCRFRIDRWSNGSPIGLLTVYMNADKLKDYYPMVYQYGSSTKSGSWWTKRGRQLVTAVALITAAVAFCIITCGYGIVLVAAVATAATFNYNKKATSSGYTENGTSFADYILWLTRESLFYGYNSLMRFFKDIPESAINRVDNYNLSVGKTYTITGATKTVSKRHTFHRSSRSYTYARYDIGLRKYGNENYIVCFPETEDTERGSNVSTASPRRGRGGAFGRAGTSVSWVDSYSNSIGSYDVINGMRGYTGSGDMSESIYLTNSPLSPKDANIVIPNMGFESLIILDD